jgi:DNA-binding transcriptional LysR family regulator
MVANKLGISILPELILRNFDSQVATYPLKPFYARTLGVAMKSKDSLSPAAKKFLKVAMDLVSELT